MIRKKLLRIAIGIVVLVPVVGILVLYGFILGPSGDLDHYRENFEVPSNKATEPGAVKVTFLGTTTLLFDDGETQLMIDGFFSRPSMWKVVTSRIETDKAAVDSALDRAQVNRLKALFVAHSHYDHAMDVAYVVQRTGAHLYGSRSTLNVGCGGGLAESQMTLFEPTKEIPVGKFGVTVLNSKHAPSLSSLISDHIGEEISNCLKQPAKQSAYTEGGSFDFLIRHGTKFIFVKPSANFEKHALDGRQADVLFLGTGRLGKQDTRFCEDYYAETVSKLKPKLVIPIHWDNFFYPLADNLAPAIKAGDNLRAGFDCLKNRLKSEEIKFVILQGYQSKVLFPAESAP